MIYLRTKFQKLSYNSLLVILIIPKATEKFRVAVVL